MAMTTTMVMTMKKEKTTRNRNENNETKTKTKTKTKHSWQKESEMATNTLRSCVLRAPRLYQFGWFYRRDAKRSGAATLARHRESLKLLLRRLAEQG